ncbi:MAG: sigma-70 region 4 domain-containing protein, partial [Bacteroidia bacterium]|nr:sigma-70 region 4 domain-containing protein [Bacteroidia bacterium]
QNRMPKSELPAEMEDATPTNIEAKVQFLYKSISELPEVDRIIISLELEDLRQAEIANIVGLSESNIRVRIHRIKDKLSQKFENYEQ